MDTGLTRGRRAPFELFPPAIEARERFLGFAPAARELREAAARPGVELGIGEVAIARRERRLGRHDLVGEPRELLLSW